MNAVAIFLIRAKSLSTVSTSMRTERSRQKGRIAQSASFFGFCQWSIEEYKNPGISRGFYLDLRLFLLCETFDPLCRLFLLQRRQLSTHLFGDLLERLKRPCGNAKLDASEAHGLQVDVLAAFRRDVGVAARVAEGGALARELINAGHRSC